MTGIAAAIRLGPRGPSDEELARLTRRMLGAFVRPADDGTDVWCGGSAALGQAWYATVPEDATRGGQVAERGPLRAVGDVRIDNREDLLAALRMPAETADLDLFTAAWEKWGDQAILRAVGDYAVAIWDERARTLSLVRDAMGGRGLYLARRGDLLLVASEMHALGIDGHVTFELDRLHAARYLVRRYNETEGSLFVGVTTAPAGGVLRVSQAGAARSLVWSPDPFARISGSLAEIAAQFREVFTSAVRARTRAVGTVAITVSGGIDSSSVACVAANDLGTKDLALLHMALPGTTADEVAFFRIVARHAGGTAFEVDPREHPADLSPSADGLPGTLHGVLTSNYAVLIKALPSPQRSVMLTGFGGDDLLGPSGYAFADFVRAGDGRGAWNTLQLTRGAGWHTVPIALWAIARLAAPTQARALYRRWRPARVTWPSWLTDASVRALDAWHRADIDAFLACPAPSEIQRGLAMAIGGRAGIQAGAPRFDGFCRARGVDVRSPFRDRRVIETLLAVPSSHRFDGRASKVVLRQAMRRTIPEVVLERADRVDFGPIVLSALRGPHRATYESFAVNPELERTDVARPGAVRQLLAAATPCSSIFEFLPIEVAVRTIRAANPQT